MFVGQYAIMKSDVSTIRKSMCNVSQNFPEHRARASAPSELGEKFHVLRALVVSTPSRPYSNNPRALGLFQGSNTVTPISFRNSPMRVRQPNFASVARDATKS